jgi:hypothetical protein
MKKLLLAVGIVLFLCVAANAQKPIPGVTGMGFKLGLAITSINTDYDELDAFLDSRDAFMGGAYLTYSFSPQLAIQPEIYYVSKGAAKDFFLFDAHWSIDYLEVPVLLKFDIMPQGPAHPNLFAGPALGVMIGSEIGALDESIDVADGMKTIDYSLVFGGGVDYKRFVLDIRYTLGLANVIDAAKVNEITGEEPGDYFYLEGDPSVKNNTIAILIGVKF